MAGERSEAACTFCGQPIAGESSAESNPCEYCDSLSGGYPHLVVLTEDASGAALGYVEGAAYPRILLTIARFLLGKNDDKLCGPVTILAHLACEVAVERTLSDAFARRGIASLEGPVSDALNGYNLANGKVRNIYTSLTGDEIREQPFWESFLRSAKRRGDIIRKGRIVGRSDAEESIRAAGDLLAHLAG